LKMNNQNRI